MARASEPSRSAASRGHAPHEEKLVEVRLALSSSAVSRLSEARVRRLLEIELDEAGVLAPGTAGPLGDHVAYVWVDLAPDGSTLVEARLADRPVYRRRIDTARLEPDVASHVVAIAATEMVRAAMRPPRPRRPTQPKPHPAELARRERRAAAVSFTGGGHAEAFTSGGAAAGPFVSAAFRGAGTSGAIFGRFAAGGFGGIALRFAEAGLALQHRVWVNTRARLVAGASASGLGVRASGGARFGADPAARGGERDALTARAGAQLGAEAHVGRAVWVSLCFEPSAFLRPLALVAANTREARLEGGAVGASIGITSETFP